MERAPLYHDVADAPDGGEGLWLRAADDVRLRAAIWPGGARGTVIVFPGRTEFVEKYGRTVHALQARGFAAAVIDWRGQGLSDRLAGDRVLGHVHLFRDYQHDAQALFGALASLGLPEPWYLLAHSMGGAIGLRALHEAAPVARSVFTGPMWGIDLSAAMRPVAWAVGWASRPLGLATRYAPGTEPRNYLLSAAFEGNTLTGDAEMFDYMARQMRAYPELELGGPSLRWVHEALRETRALGALAPPAHPALTYLGSREQVVCTRAVRRIMARWQTGRLREVPGGQHEILMERRGIRDRAIDEIAAFFAGEEDDQSPA